MFMKISLVLKSKIWKAEYFLWKAYVVNIKIISEKQNESGGNQDKHWKPEYNVKVIQENYTLKEDDVFFASQTGRK